MKHLLFVPLLFAVLCGCNSSPYEGYKQLRNDVHVRLHVLGEGEDVPSDGDSLLIRIRMGWPSEGVGELFSTEEWYAAKDLRTKAFASVLRRIHEGDSMSVIAPSEEWPWAVIAEGKDVLVPDTGHVRMEINLIKLRTASMIQADNERSRKSEPYVYERKLMHAYLLQQSGTFNRWGTSEMFYSIEGEAMDTNKVVLGDVVTISYRGRNMEEGIVFDDTERNGMPLTYRFGDKDQVLEGIGFAVELLREGQEGTFLIPSEFAFGTKGIPGIVDPYMPVVYTVRLDKVERRAAAFQR